MDNGPAASSTSTTDSRSGKPSFCSPVNAELAKAPAGENATELIKARDGLQLVSYLSLPKWADVDGDGKPSEPLPLVLNVHGGPMGARRLGLRPPSISFWPIVLRGAIGQLPRLHRLRQEFSECRSKRRWAGKMHDDLIDAVNWESSKRSLRKTDRHHGRQLRRLRKLSSASLHARRFRLRRRYRRPSNIITLMENPPEYGTPSCPS